MTVTRDNWTAPQGKSFRDLIYFLEKLKVKHGAKRLRMHKLMGSKPNEYQVILDI